MSMIEILQAATSDDGTKRNPAEHHLVQLESNNYPLYVRGLCEALAAIQQCPENARSLAALQLKNSLTGRDSSQRAAKSSRWMLLEDGLRTSVKNLVLNLLPDSSSHVRRAVAQVIGAIAMVEIPHNSWPTLVQTLASQAFHPQASAEMKETALTALGYVCEQCADYLQQESNTVLNAIAASIADAQATDGIRLAATRALTHSLEFAKANMAAEVDRKLIFKMVMEALRSANATVREAAMECLVQIAGLYYDYLAQHMREVFIVTGNAIQHEAPEVKLQAIEFWNTIAEEEMARNEEAESLRRRGQPAVLVNHDYTGLALAQLTPVILAQLPQQDEDPDSDEWNVAMAACVSLGVLSRAVGDRIVDIVLVFVNANIRSPDWRLREAATVAFGSILDGPSKEGLKPLVTQALPLLLEYVRDASPRVKDTAAWTVGRICQVLPGTVNRDMLPRVIEFVYAAMADEKASVAANACWTVHNLAAAVNTQSEAPSSPLSPYFRELLTRLWQLADSTDDAKVLPAAFEAIHVLVTNAAADSMGVVGDLVMVLMNRLRGALEQASVGLNSSMQGLLCGALQAVIEKLPVEHIRPHSSTMMMLFLGVLSTPNSAAHEEAFMVVGSLAHKLGDQFLNFMEHFKPYLVAGLTNFREVGVCTVATGCVGDCARALDLAIAPYLADLMHALLQNLRDPNVDREIKPHIISVLGDVALAAGPHFDQYLMFVMMMLVQASAVVIDDMTLDNIEYLSTLREHILNAYTGIVHGLGGAGRADALVPFLPRIVPFFELIAHDSATDATVVGAAAGLVGDILQRMGPQARSSMQNETVLTIIRLAQNSDDPDAKESGQWAEQMYRQMLA